MRAYRAPRIRTIGAIVVNPKRGRKASHKRGRTAKVGRSRRSSKSSKGRRGAKGRGKLGGQAITGRALRYGRIHAQEGRKGRKQIEISGRDLKRKDLRKLLRAVSAKSVKSLRRQQDARMKQWNEAEAAAKAAAIAAKRAKRSEAAKAGHAKRRAAKGGAPAAMANMGLGALRVNGRKRGYYKSKSRGRKRSFKSRGRRSYRRNPDLTKLTAPIAGMVRKVPFVGGTLASSLVVAPIGLLGGLAVEIPIMLAGFVKDLDFVPAIFKESQPVFLATTGLIAAPLVAMVLPGSAETKRAAGIAVAAGACGAAYYSWRTGAAEMQQVVTGQADAVSGLGAIAVGGGLGALGMGPAYTVQPDMGAVVVNPRSYGSPFGAVVVGGAT